jgi:dTDP-4-dehydrorhamnose 3,5-epimerase-like enzyme
MPSLEMLKHFGDEEKGILSYMELTDMKFIPRRIYYISKVPKGEIRGGHGHYEDQQYIFCIKGQIKINMVSKHGEENVVLNSGECVYVDRMVWGTQQYMTGDDIMLVFNSTKHDDNDKFCDKNEVLK